MEDEPATTGRGVYLLLEAAEVEGSPAASCGSRDGEGLASATSAGVRWRALGLPNSVDSRAAVRSALTIGIWTAAPATVTLDENECRY